MSEGGKTNRNKFERPSRTSLKLKVRKIAGKKLGIKRPKREKISKPPKSRANAQNGKSELKPKETSLKNNESNKFEAVILEEKIERSKEMIMWSGVGFFMLLIAFFWIYNINHTFSKMQVENSDVIDMSDWQEMAIELEEKIGEFKESYEEIKNLSGQTAGEGSLPPGDGTGDRELFSTSSVETDTATTADADTTAPEIEELIKILEEKQ